jgi:hypothetical protein
MSLVEEEDCVLAELGLEQQVAILCQGRYHRGPAHVVAMQHMLVCHNHTELNRHGEDRCRQDVACRVWKA